MIELLLAILILAIVAGGVGLMYLYRSPGSLQHRAQAEVDLHRARLDIDGAMFKQQVKSDGRRLRRELRREFDELDREP